MARTFPILILFLLMSDGIQSQVLPTGTSKVIREELPAIWQFRQQEAQDEKWLPASVPGCVHTDLIQNNIIKDPFLGTNEKDCQWVGEKNWVYKTDPFSINDGILKQEIIRMRFNGLDTYAKVILNGEVVLQAENAHRSWEIDVKNKLKKTDNVIEIIFESALTVGEKRLKELNYPLPGEAIRAITRKPQFHYGWDWGPKLITSGISKPIEIIAYDFARFTDIHIEQKEVTSEKASIKTTFQIHSAKTENAKVVFEMIRTGDIWTSDVDLKKGMNLVELPIDIEFPYLWWCNDQGNQNLYEFNAWLLHNDEVLDTEKVRTGLRSIELLTEKDSIGESFYFKLNGKPVFVKGANYIPITYFPAQATESDYRKLLQSCKDSHFNMLRVWGGGVYEDDKFYNMCDEMGIMVWQDFMFACSMYPADSLFVVNVMAEADEQTIRLRNHPSMALWCGNNENAEGWARWGWQTGLSVKTQNQLWRAYKDIFDLTLTKYVKKNTNIDYWESSPRYGRGDAKSLVEGDSHYWGIWHDEEPFEVMNTKVPRFMSEFGMQSFPSAEALSAMTDGRPVNYTDPGFAQHQKHNRGFKLMDKYMENWYPKVPHDSIAQYAFMTEVVQAEGIGLGIEAHRRGMNRCMGTMYWQLNDVWPSFSWAGIDYKGHPKLLHDYLKVIYAPQLISITADNGILNIWWISDNFRKDEDAKLSFTIRDAEGKILFTSDVTDVKLISGSHIIYTDKLARLLPKMDLKDKIISVRIEGSELFTREIKLSYQSPEALVPQVVKTSREDFLSGKKQQGYQIEFHKLKEIKLK
ncbi:MAG: glycoside hydrolase family 2 protein [Flavobacteriales bacterium]